MATREALTPVGRCLQKLPFGADVVAGEACSEAYCGR